MFPDNFPPLPGLRVTHSCITRIVTFLVRSHDIRTDGRSTQRSMARLLIRLVNGRGRTQNQLPTTIAPNAV